MKHLAKRDNAVQAKAPKNTPDIYPGDRFIDDDGYVYLVKKVQATKDGEGCITYGCAYDLTDPDTRTTDFDHFLSGKYLKVDGTGTPEEIEAAMFAKALQLKHTDDDEENEQAQGPASGSREIATCLDKGALISMQKAIEERKRSVEIVRRFVEGKRNELRSIMSVYSKQVEKIQSALQTIELYLGISEQILQFGAGEPAPMSTPITFRQQVLYMDEEIGDPEDGGMDKCDMDKWDAWVLKNFAKVLPEVKGIVLFKPRRYDKDYGGTWLENFFANQGNFKTYVLIRNGQNFYRIWTTHEVGEQVFPSRKHMEKINRVMEGGSAGRGSYFDQRDAEKEMLEYKRTMLLFQGLIDRTQIFAPIKPGIMLNKPQTYKDGSINFIYDNEPALGTGHISYPEWHKACNAKIVRGTRVYFTGLKEWGRNSKYWCEEHNMRYGNYTVPDAGVYSVKYMLDEKTGVAIYHSGGEVYVPNYWRKGLSSCYQPRRRGEGFKVFHRDTDIINYDMLSLADIEYFLQDRYERRRYLEMMPILYGLRKERLAELEWEKGFADNLVLRLGLPNTGAIIVWQAIEWWKRKVIWKRPIMKEDAKALRMITSRVRRQLKKGGK